MITNKSITYYHKIFNNQTKLEEWDRYIFDSVWFFGGKGSGINSGYENANDMNVRIPMEYVNNKNIFQRGDIVAVGIHNNIAKQSDLKDVEFYNVTSININDFGNNPQIHLGGV